jgi:hypothetical protein
MPKKTPNDNFFQMRHGAAFQIVEQIIELMSNEFGTANTDMYLECIYGATPQALAKQRKNINSNSVKIIVKAIEDRMARVFSEKRLRLILATAQAGTEFTVIRNKDLAALQKAAGLLVETAPDLQAPAPGQVKTSIERLVLTNRAKNVLYGQKINFVEDLVRYTWEDLRRMRGGGPVFRDALERALRAEGLKLREDEPAV